MRQHKRDRLRMLRVQGFRKLLRIGFLDGIEVRHVRAHGLHHAV
jgi:hypothetical protein